ncbi:MAG: hypothetical protein ACQERO_14535, partial [Bacteroidota bacterium]
MVRLTGWINEILRLRHRRCRFGVSAQDDRVLLIHRAAHQGQEIGKGFWFAPPAFLPQASCHPDRSNKVRERRDLTKSSPQTLTYPADEKDNR